MILTEDKDGYTVLHYAAGLGSAEVMGYLLSELPLESVRQLMKMGGLYDGTPLIYATRNQRDVGVIKQLIEFIRRNCSSAGRYLRLFYRQPW